MSADVATVLSVSRFAKHFNFESLDTGMDNPADDVYSSADPFAYCVANNIKKASVGCCPKPAKPDNGVCPEPAEQETGSCTKRPKIESKGACC